MRWLVVAAPTIGAAATSVNGNGGGDGMGIVFGVLAGVTLGFLGGALWATRD